MSRVAAQGPAGPWRVVFDGQSHNLLPGNVEPAPPWEAISGPEHLNYPSRLMAGRGIPWTNVAIGGASWTTLATTAATRLWPIAGTATATILVMVGGTNDITDGDTGAQAYADAVSYAEAARTNGFGPIIAGTIPGAASLNASHETQRQSHNALLLANGDGAFDYVVDFDATALADWTDPVYYFTDEIHWVAAGAQLAAETVAPYLDAALGL